jgi:integrase
VFPTHRGGPQAQISTGWKAALKRANIEPEFRWHDLRHTWASWHVMSGTPLEVLQRLGGWSSLAMVMRYAHLSPDHLAGFANNAKPWKAMAQSVA